MRIELNRDLCSGHGRCYTLAPDVFEADDDGYCAGSVEVPPGLEDQGLRAVRSCPEGALTVLDPAASG